MKRSRKAGDTRPDSSSSPSLREMPMDMTPSRGMPTAVMRRPNRARGRAEPALAPRIRGKIRFPAPKNRPKRVEPISASWRGESFSFKVRPSLFIIQFATVK